MRWGRRAIAMAVVVEAGGNAKEGYKEARVGC